MESIRIDHYTQSPNHVHENTDKAQDLETQKLLHLPLKPVWPHTGIILEAGRRLTK